MLKNFIKIAWRNAIRNRAQSAISLTSLILGFTFFCLIMLWVKDEMSYDKGFESAGRICRVETTLTMKDGSSSSLATVGWPVGRVLASEYPKIESVTYMSDWTPIINYKGAKFYETVSYADKNFFNVFGNELLRGNPATALSEPYSLVISESLKQKYFGSGEAMGKILMLNDTVPYKITGILKTSSTPSHLVFDLLGSFSSRTASTPQAWE